MRGRCRDHVGEEVEARRAVFKRMWNLSSIPLACEWYAVVVMCWMLSKLQTAAHTEDVNCGPLSDVSASGTPKRPTQCCKNTVAMPRAVVSATGTASGQRVDLSIMVKM